MIMFDRRLVQKLTLYYLNNSLFENVECQSSTDLSKFYCIYIYYMYIHLQMVRTTLTTRGLHYNLALLSSALFSLYLD